MSLPLPWVDKIFTKLTLAYGRQFLGRWEGLDLDAVKCDWADELSRFQQSPQAIAYALENLPLNEPPTALQFRAICFRRPDMNLALPEPAADPARVAEAMGKISLALDRPSSYDPKGWARRIIAKHEDGYRVSSISLRFAREALHLHLNPTPEAA